MNDLFRKVYGAFLLKETKDGPVVISRTATEIEAIQAKAKLHKLSLVSQRINPDMCYFRLATPLPLKK